MSTQAKLKKKAQTNGKQKPISFGAYPDQLERWTKAAKAMDRPLGWWIRYRLEQMDTLDQQALAQGVLQEKS